MLIRRRALDLSRSSNCKASAQHLIFCCLLKKEEKNMRERLKHGLSSHLETLLQREGEKQQEREVRTLKESDSRKDVEEEMK